MAINHQQLNDSIEDLGTLISRASGSHAEDLNAIRANIENFLNSNREGVQVVRQNMRIRGAE